MSTATTRSERRAETNLPGMNREILQGSRLRAPRRSSGLQAPGSRRTAGSLPAEPSKLDFAAGIVAKAERIAFVEHPGRFADDQRCCRHLQVHGRHVAERRAAGDDAADRETCGAFVRERLTLDCQAHRI